MCIMNMVAAVTSELRTMAQTLLDARSDLNVENQWHESLLNLCSHIPDMVPWIRSEWHGLVAVPDQGHVGCRDPLFDDLGSTVIFVAPVRIHEPEKKNTSSRHRIS